MPTRKEVAPRHRESPTAEKVMQTWRMPKDLVHFLRAEALQHQFELTPFATKLLNGYRNYYELPTADRALLEQDRSALRMGRFEYLQHVLNSRAEEVSKQSPGFDKPKT